MRLIFVLLLSCLAGTSAGVALLYVSTYFYYSGQIVSGADLTGVAGLSFIFSGLLCLLLYAPVLFWLRRLRSGCEPAALFPLFSAFVLNVPVALVLVAGMKAGSFSGWSEVTLLTSAFVAAGSVFGFGFVWHCRSGARARAGSF